MIHFYVCNIRTGGVFFPHNLHPSCMASFIFSVYYSINQLLGWPPAISNNIAPKTFCGTFIKNSF